MKDDRPHKNDAGYILSVRSGARRKGWVVIYGSRAAGLDATDGPYAIVCQEHKQIVNVRSLIRARYAMRFPDSFCGDCRKVSEAR